MTLVRPYGTGVRQTKVIATLGPATESEEVLRGLFEAGVDAVRLNFSHGNKEDHIRFGKIVRKLQTEQGYHVAIIGDLQGPKIRIERFAKGKVTLKEGAKFDLVTNLDRDAGDGNRVGVTYPNLAKDVKVDDQLLLDDGRIGLKVVGVKGATISTKVIIGGELSSNKGLNRRGGGLSASSITRKDEEDIRTAAEIGVDYLAISFPRNASDMKHAHKLLAATKLRAGVIAKIERSEALENIDEILEYCDGVMIARGDLSLEIGDAALTAVQKRLINLGRERCKVVITATEMMQSMVTSTVPTRAEISDVANAVLDGTDAVMLSAETAIGKHPVLAVKTMGRICYGAEHNAPMPHEHDIRGKFDNDDSAIAMSAIYAGKGLGVAVIAALTESGSTALWMSRVLSPIPIYALTPHSATCCKITIYRGVYPGYLGGMKKTHPEVNEQVSQVLKRCRAVREGDKIIITKGDLVGKTGGTNALKIMRIPGAPKSKSKAKSSKKAKTKKAKSKVKSKAKSRAKK